MSAKDDSGFYRVCRQFHRTAMAMVFGVGGAFALCPFVLPHGYKLEGVVVSLPAACYLFGVWAIGRALGEIAKGRPIQAALRAVLRRVGVSLAAGSLISVFVVGGLARLAGSSHSDYVNFSVASMTLGMIGAALYLLSHVVDQALAAQAELNEMI